MNPFQQINYVLEQETFWIYFIHDLNRFHVNSKSWLKQYFSTNKCLFFLLSPFFSIPNCITQKLKRKTKRSSVEKMKNAKNVDVSGKSKDCQLQSMSQARENGISTPLVDSSLMRHSPQLMGEPPDVDDTDPDVIPNQYGE
jgi:hypothetical protein